MTRLLDEVPGVKVRVTSRRVDDLMSSGSAEVWISLDWVDAVALEENVDRLSGGF